MRTTVSVPSPIAALAAGAPVDRLRRAFTLTGLVPLGVFVVAHAAVNAFALRGEGAFASAEDAVGSFPAMGLVEILFVLLPLAVHAALGLWLWIARPAALAATPYPPALRVAMRVTAIVALVFIVWHALALRLQAPGGAVRGAQLATLLVRDLSSTWKGVPWRGVAYLVGAGCAVFHFCAGAWGVFAGSPLGRAGRRHPRIAGWAAVVAGAVLWLLLADVVVFHATGARLFGGSVEDPPPAEPCP
jgi:succinate dehydrogenase / fumarate reductase cytochrome b subunit